MKIEIAPEKTAKARWMVVDDDAAIRRFIGTMLERSGKIEAAFFSSGTAAWDAFAAAPATFEFVVTDFEMPGMDGADLCAAIQAISPKTQVLLVTGNDSLSEAQVLAWGFCGLMRKPFSATALWQLTETQETRVSVGKNFLNKEAHGCAA